jgi:hypothetical protein
MSQQLKKKLGDIITNHIAKHTATSCLKQCKSSDDGLFVSCQDGDGVTREFEVTLTEVGAQNDGVDAQAADSCEGG